MCNFDYDLSKDFIPHDVKFVDCRDVDIIHYDSDECFRWESLNYDPCSGSVRRSGVLFSYLN